MTLKEKVFQTLNVVILRDGTALTIIGGKGIARDGRVYILASHYDDDLNSDYMTRSMDIVEVLQGHASVRSFIREEQGYWGHLNRVSLRDGKWALMIGNTLFDQTDGTILGTQDDYDVDLHHKSVDRSNLDIMRIWRRDTSESLYDRSVIDWTKVEVDTPILVHGKNSTEWKRRHFAKYENGKVYAFVNGHSSWTSKDYEELIDWEFAEIAKEVK